MDKKLPICIVLAMLMSCFSCKQPQQPTEDAGHGYAVGG